MRGPDSGPPHARFAAITAKTREIARKLYGLGPPSTKGGISAMAEAAITHWPMRADQRLQCESVTDWMAHGERPAHLSVRDPAIFRQRRGLTMSPRKKVRPPTGEQLAAVSPPGPTLLDRAAVPKP
jgi:hypothetical protein